MTAPGPYSFYIDRKNNGLGIVEGPRITDDDYHQLVINLDPRTADLQAQILNAAHASGVQAERKRLREWLAKYHLPEPAIIIDGEMHKLLDELERAEG